ncbi:MAG: ABC transporter ATP-binding protein [Acidimicrobiia bacterium]|nr:ABC transporter ATP-binding protein [Acidimicrobiia bacterium]
MSKPSPISRLWRYATHHRPQILRASLWSFLNKAFDIAPPLLIGLAIDIVVEQDGSVIGRFFPVETLRGQVVVLAILTFIVWGLESLFEYLHGIEWRNLAQTVQHELRIDAYDHMQHLEMAYFEDQTSGNLMAIVNDDVNQLERFMDHGANDLIQMLTTVVLIGGFFFVAAPSVAWLAFLPIPLILWGSFRFQRRLEPLYARVRAQAGAVNSQLGTNLGGIATIKSYTSEDREKARISEESDRYRLANKAAIRLSSAFSPLIRIVILVGFMATLVWGGFETLDGDMDTWVYATMVFLTQRLLWPLTRLGETMDLYQRAMASTTRILDVLDTEASITDGDRHIDPLAVKGDLRFDRVTFAYHPGIPVIRDVSIEIAPGTTVAFVGATGSGKTTMVKLLLRFYDVTTGAISLDGIDIRELRLHDLRSSIGFVSQDVFLFHGTVLDNIAYGRADASFDEVVAAAEVAEAHEFILDLPNGYETIVGERGQKLSGGQRQRISIARAVLSQSPVLVLDEATSAVDNETEAAIQRSLEVISRERTTVVIAHRLSTIRHADQIYVLDAGRVIEAGTHDELVAFGGSYRALWDVQTGDAVEHHPHGVER